MKRVNVTIIHYLNVIYFRYFLIRICLICAFWREVAEGSTELSMLRDTFSFFLAERFGRRVSQRSPVSGPRGILRDVHSTALMAVEPAPGSGSAALPHRCEFTALAYEQLGGEARWPR